MKKFKKFRNKIFLPFLLLNLFFMLVMSFFLYENMSRLLRKREDKLVESKLYQASELLDYHLKGALEATSLIYMDKSYEESLENLSKVSNAKEHYEQYQYLSDKTRGLRFSKDVFNIRYFIDKDEGQYQSQSFISSVNVLKEKGFYDDLMLSPYAVVWFEDEINPYGVGSEKRDVVSAGRLISKHSDKEMFVLVDILKSDLIHVLDRSYLQEEGLFKLKSPQGNVIWSGGDTEQIDGGRFQEISLSTSWSIEYFLSSSIYSQLRSETRNIFLLLLPISIMSLAYVSYRLSKRLTQDLEDFSYQLKMKGEGIDIGSIPIDREDEIGDFQRTIQKLLENVEAINKSHYESKLALKQEQLLRIQSQINPHFLYNIFDFLYWTAIEKNDIQMADTILDISDFYRNSLYENDDYVYLKQELAQVKAYVNIQNARYDEKINLDISLDDPDLLDEKVMNFLLQPIVENALIHGVLESTEERGSIKIRVYSKKEFVMVKVHDNGPGFPESVLATQKTNGFGIESVKKRLNLMYGKKSFFKCGNDNGAWVLIGIPKERSRI